MSSESSISKMLDNAKHAIDAIVNRSTIFDPECEAALPRFKKNELVLGKIIGRGGFCIVKEITQIKAVCPNGSSQSLTMSFKSMTSDLSGTSSGTGKLKRMFSNGSARSGSNLVESMASAGISIENVTASTPDEMNREYLITTSRASSTPKYVMKRVSEELKHENINSYIKGCIDLAIETKFLSSLSHPCILNIRGVSSVGPFQEGYFIIIDRLGETLPKRLKGWMTIDRQTKGVTGIFVGGKKKVNDLLVNRLCCAFDIASALSYLHELRIVYRDVKPDNIGFSKSGRVKIFDFGLAKELNEDERTKDGLYRMTGFTGSVRYMAPEVGQAKPYNEEADVYSFAILLWYILALEPPFGLFTPKMILERVPKGYRPVLVDAWSEGIKMILSKCWNGKIKARPSFPTVMEMLKREVALIAPEKVDAMIHHSAAQPIEESLCASV